MATKHTSKCLQNAGDDEEIFVLRASDISAPSVIRHWLHLNAGNPNLSQEKKEEAYAVSLRMEQWPNRKNPD